MKLLKKALGTYLTYLLAVVLLLTPIAGCKQPPPLGAVPITGAVTNVQPPFVEISLHPFATGFLTTSASQNSTLYYSTSVNGTYSNTEVIKITQPIGYTLAAMEFNLIGRVISSNATSLAWYRWMISDNLSSWQALASSSGNLTGATSVNSTAWVDTYPYMGRFVPTGNVTGDKSVFYLTMQTSNGTQGANVTAVTKGSSYIILTYRRGS